VNQVDAASHEEGSSGLPLPLDPRRAAILLVDDKPDKLMAIQSLIDDIGQPVVTARSGPEALRALLREEFAVILLDVKMPGMDGFETAQLIRGRKATEHTPIIFVTAYNDNETDMSRGYALGAVDFIFTPVVPAILRAKIAVFIDLFLKTRQVGVQADLLREAAEQRAARLESRLEGLLNRLDVGVFRTALDGRLVEANPAFYRLLHLPIGVPINLTSVYIRPEERTEIVERLHQKGRVQGHTVQLRCGDGQTIWASMTKTLAHDPSGQDHIDGMLEDVSANKESEDVLIRKTEELARSNAELEQFAYVASHDLQEPLRMLSVYSSLLAERYRGKLDEKADGFLAYTVEGAQRMQTLITDLLAYSRVGSNVERSFAMVDCEALFDRCLFNLQVSIQERGATVTHDPLPTILGDEVLIGQLLQNLVANAIKFSPESPAVHVGAVREGDGWRFSVKDNGIGIPAEHHTRIFGIFHRLHARHEYPGTGIGLAVCRRVVERHGGRIWVESEPGAGSTFSFVLPITEEAGAHAERAASVATGD
jgi:PAS domain S-box-containing protein